MRTIATLAVDVGMTNYGMAVFYNRHLTDWAVVLTKPNKKLSRGKDYAVRGCLIVDALERLFNKHKPLRLIAEMPSRGSQSAVASHAMGYSSGLTVAWARGHNVELTMMQARKCFSLFHDVKKGTKIPTKDRKNRTMKKVLELYPELASVKTKKEFESIADAVQCWAAWAKENSV